MQFLGLRIKFLLVFSLLGMLMLSSCVRYNKDTYKVTALILENKSGEDEILDLYKSIFLGQVLEVEKFQDKQSYQSQINSLLSANSLPHIYTNWYGERETELDRKSVDLNAVMDLSRFNPVMFRRENLETPIKVAPTEFTVGNIILINAHLLESLLGYDKKEIEHISRFKMIVHHGGMLNLRSVVLLNTTDALSDYFFSAVLGARDGRWFTHFAKGENGADESSFVQALHEFGTAYPFLNPMLWNMSPAESKQMFINGRALMIMGDSNELTEVTRSVDFPLDYMTLPLYTNSNYDTAGSFEPWQGVSVNSNYSSYSPALRSNIYNFLIFYTGSYTQNLRLREWGAAVPLKDYTISRQEAPLLAEKMEIVSNLDALYQVPSDFLSPTQSHSFNEDLKQLLAGNMSPQDVANRVIPQLKENVNTGNK